MGYVTTPQPGSRTTQLLSPEAQRTGRYVAAGLVVFLVLAAVALDRVEHSAAAEKAETVQYIILIATPTARPPEPTSAPAIVAAPPTAEPQIVYQTVEVPILVEVQRAPEVEPTAEWRVPFVLQDACTAWHAPQPYPEGCP